MRYAWIQQHTPEFPVGLMCEVRHVSRSSHYAWRNRPTPPRQIRQAYAQGRGVYGAPRIHRELIAQEVRVCQNTIARLMREEGLPAKTCRRFRVQTTDGNHGHPVAQSLLNQQFSTVLPNTVWATDITYVLTDEGWLYLAVVLDLCSRRIVDWAMALTRRKPPPALLHHSDRGEQYACGEYQQLLEDHRTTCSMSRTGNCYDNAVMESLFGTLKTEPVYLSNYHTREQLKQLIFEYIKVFHNRKRRHSAFGYRGPAAFWAGLN